MIEDNATIRRKTVERLNGFWVTWYHYNRMTLVVTLSAIAALSWHWRMERVAREQAEATTQAAIYYNLGCYDHKRATTLLIVGDSYKALNDGLMAAAIEADMVRLAWKEKAPR